MQKKQIKRFPSSSAFYAIYFLSLIVGQLQLIKHVEYQAKDHSGDAGQHHTGELDVSKVHLNAGEAGNEDHGSCQPSYEGRRFR